MTRVALISDQHIDRSSRWDECRRILAWITSDLVARRPDLVLLGGDLFERRPTPEETLLACEWVQSLARLAPVVVIYGNHDAPQSLEPLALLDAPHPIIVADRPAVHLVAGVAVACLPWPRPANLLAALGRAVPAEESAQHAVEALRAVLLGLGDQLEAHDGPRVVLSHAMVRGSRTSTGQPLVGCDLEIGLDDLALARADAYLLGHVHARQGWGVPHRIGIAPIHYPGSPRRTSYGEVEPKGYMLFDFGEGRLRWKHVDTPATPMLLLTGEYVSVDEGPEGRDIDRVLLHPEHNADVAGAEVRLRYHVVAHERDAGKRAAERLRAELVERGAVAIKVEEVVVAETRARSPEVAAAQTLTEKIDAYWSARGFDPGDRRESLHERLVALEEDCRADP